MKTPYYILLLASLFLSSCDEKPKTSQADSSEKTPLTITPSTYSDFTIPDSLLSVEKV